MDRPSIVLAFMTGADLVGGPMLQTEGVDNCALAVGTSVAKAMGMTALDGLPMGRRSGVLDPPSCFA